MEIFDTFMSFSAQTIAYFTANPDVLKALGGVVAALFLFKVIRRLIPVKKDSRRMFTKAERMAGFARAGNRCELDGFLWLRCSRKAEHGDHHFPWSRGGATTMENFVAACAHCNTSKGAKVPTRFATWRMTQRRRGYFPKGTPYKAGAKVSNRKRQLPSGSPQDM